MILKTYMLVFHTEKAVSPGMVLSLFAVAGKTDPAMIGWFFKGMDVGIFPELMLLNQYTGDFHLMIDNSNWADFARITLDGDFKLLNQHGWSSFCQPQRTMKVL